MKRIFKVLGILVFLFLLYFVWEIRMPTPDVDESLTPQSFERVQVGADHFKVNNSWLKKNEHGVWEMYVEGSPYERGVIYGLLSKELMEKQEDHFVAQINEIVPSRFYLFFLKMFVAWFNKDLDTYIPEENLKEIYGASLSFSEKYNYVGPAYYRILNYHAAHDIGHALADLAMVGCTSFSVNKEYSADSSLLIGRNFDFYMGDKFAEDKLLLFMNPTEGYKFASYSWAGLTGVVSGMNEKGLTVTLNASKSDIPLGAKDPISLLAREILQYAKNIEEAVKIAKKRETFVSESLLIGSAEDNKSIIIEKSPTKQDVYHSDQDYLVCANHYQSDLFKNDSMNIQNMLNSDSKFRFEQMNNLLSESFPISTQKAVDILRNKEGEDGKFIGYGNSKSLNQLIAHHGIVFKPSQRKFWISTAPYQLGEFLCYDLNQFENPTKMRMDSMEIKVDSFVFSADFSKYESFKKTKHKINKFVNLGIDFELSEGVEKEFVANNPESYVTYLVLGDYYSKKSNFSQAHRYYQEALRKDVASRQEIDQINEKVQGCKQQLTE